MFKTKFGNVAKNQTIIQTSRGSMFVSYGTNIALIEHNNNIVLDNKYWRYSNTTNFYRNQFLNEDIKATRKKIVRGEYKFEDLQLVK